LYNLVPTGGSKPEGSLKKRIDGLYFGGWRRKKDFSLGYSF
jgi:hypothetical protein